MDADRFRYVTQRYSQLQGYCMLPLAALFLLSYASRASGIHLPGSGTRWFMAGLTAALAASYALRAWYTARFGAVSQRWFDSAVVPVLVVVACLPVAIAIQQQAHLPFSLPLALIAAALAGVGLGHYPLRRHYLAAAAVCAGLALAPAFGVGAETGDILMDAAIGVSLAIVGVGDHRLLANTIKPRHAHV